MKSENGNKFRLKQLKLHVSYRSKGTYVLLILNTFLPILTRRSECLFQLVACRERLVQKGKASLSRNLITSWLN